MSSQEQEGRRIIKRYEILALGAGIVPVPVFDLVALVAIQLLMLGRLSALYKVPLSENRAKTTIAALLGGIVPTDLAWGAPRSFIKAIPVVGEAVALLTMPAFAAASTYAVGMLFLRHFESGGTLLDFDAKAARKELRKALPAAATGAAAGATAGAAAGGKKTADAEKKSPAAARVAKKKSSAAAGAKESLTKIEGVGPAIEKLLREAGIDSYAKLAATELKQLETILDKPRYRIHKASAGSWRQQAKLAADGKWDELKKLQAKLKGGRAA